MFILGGMIPIIFFIFFLYFIFFNFHYFTTGIRMPNHGIRMLQMGIRIPQNASGYSSRFLLEQASKCLETYPDTTT